MFSLLNISFFHKATHFFNSASVLAKFLKFVSTIFYQIFIFSPNDNYEKCFLFHIKSSFRSRDIQIFVIFSLLFHTFHIQIDKWKWNNLWCHESACNFWNCSKTSKTALYYIIKLVQIIHTNKEFFWPCFVTWRSTGH